MDTRRKSLKTIPTVSFKKDRKNSKKTIETSNKLVYNSGSETQLEYYQNKINKWLDEGYIVFMPNTNNQRLMLSIPKEKSSLYNNLDWLKLQLVYSKGGNGITYQAIDEARDKIFVLKTSLFNTSKFILDDEPDPLQYEYLIMLCLNESRKYIPNFTQTFGFFTCSSDFYDYIITHPHNKDFKQELNKLISSKNIKLSCYKNDEYNLPTIVIENITPAYTLKSFTIEYNNNEIEKILLYVQVLLALQVAQDKYDFTHYDLHGLNVLLQDLVSTTTLFENIMGFNNSSVSPFLNYIVRGKSYFFPSNYITMIIDFGRSHIKFPEAICKDNDTHKKVLFCNPQKYEALKYWTIKNLEERAYVYNDLLKQLKISGWFEFINLMTRENIDIPYIELNQDDSNIEAELSIINKRNKYIQQDSDMYYNYDIFLIYHYLYVKTRIVYNKRIDSLEMYGINPSLFNPVWDMYKLAKSIFTQHTSTPLINSLLDYIESNFKSKHDYEFTVYTASKINKINKINKPIDLVEWIFNRFSIPITSYINNKQQNSYITFNFSDEDEFKNGGLHYKNEQDKIIVFEYFKNYINQNKLNILTNPKLFSELKSNSEIFNLKNQVVEYLIETIA